MRCLDARELGTEFTNAKAVNAKLGKKYEIWTVDDIAANGTITWGNAYDPANPPTGGLNSCYKVGVQYKGGTLPDFAIKSDATEGTTIKGCTLQNPGYVGKSCLDSSGSPVAVGKFGTW